MYKKKFKSPKNVIFCKKCVHTNQKVTSSSTFLDDKEHKNKNYFILFFVDKFFLISSFVKDVE